MATKLKNLNITSTDLVDKGANPDAFICLAKSHQAKSLPDEVSSLKEKVLEVLKSLFTEEIEKAEENTGYTEVELPTEVDSVEKKEDLEMLEPTDLTEQEDLTKSYDKEVNKVATRNKPVETVDNSVDKAEDVEKSAIDVKKMALELEEVRKKLALKELEDVAKCYEVLGKRKSELAPILYAMAQAGEEVYKNYVQSLDEQVDLVEKRGIFQEYGSEMSGGAIATENLLDVKANEIAKRDGVSKAIAFTKAYEEYPELASEYEQGFEKNR